MNRFLAIVEREMRKFFRSPVLMIMSMMLPLVQLIILGNAFGGKVRGAKSPWSTTIMDRKPLKFTRPSTPSQSILQRSQQSATRMKTRPVRTCEPGKSMPPLSFPRNTQGVSMRKMRHASASSLTTPISFLASSIAGEMQSLVDAINRPVIQPRVVKNIAIEIVELYPYVEYMKYLLSGSIALAMYISVMIGGGMLYIDDKARGVHEGYLVTPITKLELVMGLNIAGAIKAVLAGISLTVIGSLMAGLGVIFHPMALLQLFLLILGTSIAFNGMMFLMMVRVDDPLVPRAMFGVLNTLLFFPSGAIYPIAAFPKWLRAIAIVDPFTYAIHGFKAILLKDGGFAAIQTDLIFLFVFGIGTLLIATPLFKRTL